MADVIETLRKRRATLEYLLAHDPEITISVRADAELALLAAAEELNDILDVTARTDTSGEICQKSDFSEARAARAAMAAMIELPKRLRLSEVRRLAGIVFANDTGLVVADCRGTLGGHAMAAEIVQRWNAMMAIDEQMDVFLGSGRAIAALTQESTLSRCAAPLADDLDPACPNEKA